jgi:HEAT repeat protein
VRHALVNLLGETGGEGAIFPLHQQLRSDDVMARISAIMALGQLGTDDALHELLQVLENPNSLPPLSPPRELPAEMLGFYNPIPQVRKAAVDALANWNDGRIVSPLVYIFHGVEAFGPEMDLFLSATNVLRKLAKVHERDFNGVSAHLNSDDAVARMAAALSLMWLRDARAMDELKPLLKDDDADVRHAASWSRRALEEVLSYDQPEPTPMMIQFMLR